MALNVTLVVVGGDVKTPEVKLRLPSTVGRGRDCSIMLRHPLVSRQHCEIFESAGTLLVRDLGSLNGTFVNNQRIEGDAQLHPGQLLTIGTVTFRAMYDLADAAESPPDSPPPQMKPSKPSSETNADGALTWPAKVATETVRNSPPSATPPTEPVDVDMDFDLDDAKPLFAEVDNEKTSEDLSKNGAGKGNSSNETVFAPSKGKPAAPPPPAAAKPAPPPPAPAAAKPVAPAPPKPAAPPPKPAAPAKPADEKSAAKSAPPAKTEKADAPAFDFLESDGGGSDGEEDDDLNDFLKNLK